MDYRRRLARQTPATAPERASRSPRERSIWRFRIDRSWSIPRGGSAASEINAGLAPGFSHTRKKVIVTLQGIVMAIIERSAGKSQSPALSRGGRDARTSSRPPKWSNSPRLVDGAKEVVGHRPQARFG